MSENFLKINKGLSMKGQTTEPAGANGDVYFNETLGKFRKFENGSWSNLASSGAGTKNYISNGDAEANADGWSGYADAAGTRPVDGTGGSPNVTFTRSTSSPLAGQASFLFTKDAANRQGQGFSYNFTIDPTDKAKVLSIEIDYQVVSGIFAAGSNTTDSDVIVYIYDITNNLLIEPSSFKFLSNSSTLSDKFRASFQSSPNSVSYRLILHVASTSASAYSLKFDDVKVGPNNYVFGTPDSDLGQQTWGITGATGNATLQVSRHGRRIFIDGYINVNSAVTSQVTLNIPSAYLADSNTYNLLASVSQPIGCSRLFDTSAGQVYDSIVQLSSISTISTVSEQSGSTYVQPLGTTATTPFTWASGDKIYVQASWVVGAWGSSTQMSDQTDTRIVAFKARRSTDQTGVNTNNTDVKMTFNQVTSDTHGAFNTTTNQYVVPVSGYYIFTGSIQPLNTNILASRYQARIYKNGSSLNFSHNPVHNSGVAETLHCTTAPEFCSQGDTIELRYFGAGNNSASTITINSDSTVTFLSGMRVSGPQAIAASESVTFNRNDDSAQSFVGNTIKDITWNTAQADSHSAYNSGTGVYTIPTSGVYLIYASMRLNSPTLTTTQGFELSITDSSGAAIYAANSVFGNGNNVQYNVQVSTSNRFLAGQTIKIRGISSIAASSTTATAHNRFYIIKVGN